MDGAKRRVVVTGIGMVTPIGLTVRDNWQNILACKSGIVKLTKFSIPDYPVNIAGEVNGFDPTDFIERKDFVVDSKQCNDTIAHHQLKTLA